MTSGMRYSFGPYTLAPDAAELRRADERIELQPKCVEVLAYLVANAGRVVSKQELLERLWPRTVVEEGTLSEMIRELRAALGDEPDAPQYIESVSRRGYRFLQAVDFQGSALGRAYDFSLMHGTREYPLDAGENVIGRERDASVQIYTPAVSRHHALVTIKDAEVWIEDLASANGTKVNGKTISAPVQLAVGDEIRIGTEVLVLRGAKSHPSA